MTRKERILKMLERQHEDVSYEQVISRLVLMRKVEVALEQADRGEGTEHEELFRRLEKEWQEQESESSGRRRPKQISSKSVASSPKTLREGPPHSRTA
jgi:hypothetical protein